MNKPKCIHLLVAVFYVYAVYQIDKEIYLQSNDSYHAQMINEGVLACVNMQHWTVMGLSNANFTDARKPYVGVCVPYIGVIIGILKVACVREYISAVTR